MFLTTCYISWNLDFSLFKETVKLQKHIHILENLTRNEHKNLSVASEIFEHPKNFTLITPEYEILAFLCQYSINYHKCTSS